jgi:exopolysaccharide biosynthesis polyprenyl glycosylphosphotransferase
MTGRNSRRQQEYSLIFMQPQQVCFGDRRGFPGTQVYLCPRWLIMSWGSLYFLPLSVVSRLAGVYYLRRYGFWTHNAVIIGANNEGISLAKQLTDTKSSGLNIVGFIDKKSPVGEQVLDDLIVLGDVDILEKLITDFEITELILATSAFSSRDRMMEIFRNYGISGEINLRMSSGLYEIFTTGMTIKEIAYIPLVCLNKVRLTGLDHFLKLLLDYSITIPAFILLSPLIAMIALAIKLDSKGPVIFPRRVMGMNGQQFDAYKFRTMYINGEEILAEFPGLKRELSRNHKLKFDPRVTRVGRFLRRASLDELPQLFNVLKRDMSWVGPRIISPEEMQNYSRWDLNLLTVKPGISGLWQVSGRSDISYEERVRLDMHYIRNWSIWFDLQILIRTVPAVIKGKGLIRNLFSGWLADNKTGKLNGLMTY